MSATLNATLFGQSLWQSCTPADWPDKIGVPVLIPKNHFSYVVSSIMVPEHRNLSDFSFITSRFRAPYF